MDGTPHDDSRSDHRDFILPDFSVPAPGRRYDHLLGGKDALGPDRESAHSLRRVFPDVALAARESRRFMCRAVSVLADDLGVRQFLDIGAGYPAVPDVHEIAQAVDPAARVLYVDNDRVAGVHTRALRYSTPEGDVQFLQADLRDPAAILDSAVLHDTLDLHRPVALLLMAVLHFVDDDDRPVQAVRRLAGALAPGSYVALSHGTTDYMPAHTARQIQAMSGPEHGTLRPRTRAEIEAFVDGLSLLEPGLVPVVDWHREQEPHAEATAAQASAYGVVARIG